MDTRRFSGFERGAALLAVLAIVVILTVLLISFTLTTRLDRQSTSNYTQGIRAQEISEVAVSEITANLFREIAAGSRNDSSLTVDGIRVHVPLTNSTVLPLRQGYPASSWGLEPSGSQLPPGLVKVSRNGAAYPAPYDPTKAPANPASGVPTDAVSGNGRIISAERWNKSRLLGPSVPQAFSDDPPDWVYVTREGSQICSDADVLGGVLRQDAAGANTKAVLGRYAYTIYDQGSLLDINIAGIPETVAGTLEAGRKSGLGYADMARIPGLDRAKVAAFISWRNKGGLLLEGGYDPLVRAQSARNNRAFKSGDNPLLNRQDLLAYLEKVVGDLTGASYLSTVSLGVNAPSHSPGNPTAENPLFVNVRAAADGTLARYRMDGSQQTYPIAKGEPFVRRRFPLERLSWLTPYGPSSAAVVQAIRSCFGLEWEASNARWNYLETANVLPSPVVIKTLAQVAQESREPNFFELLKAAILNGSLGVHPGAYPGFDGAGLPAGIEGPAGQYFETFSGVPDVQILQIGASIIDQADTDSYPTRIFCNVFGGSRPEDALFNSVFGIENLPYFHRLHQVTLATVPGDAGPPAVAGKIGAWLQPELWNPHRTPPAEAPSGDRPTQFRVRTYGRAQTAWSQRWSPTFWQSGFSPTVLYSDNGGPAADFSKGCLYFNDSADASVFRERPSALTTANVDASLTDPKCLFSETAYPHITAKANSFAGVFTGEAPFAPKANPGSADPYIGNVSPKTYPNVGERSFVLEYRDADGNWLPYTLIARFKVADANTIPIGSATHATQIVGGTAPQCFYFHVDPRTDRFSVSEDYPNAANSGFSINRTIQPDAVTTHSVWKFWPRTLSGFTYSPGTQRWLGSWQGNTAGTCYADRDGVVRPADGFRRNPATGDGCLTFHGGAEAPRRPVILDRPFRSVAELGYVFRDLPYKSLDFWSEKSADGALLDVFSIETQDGVAAGHVNLNRAPAKVLEALLAGTSKNGLTAAPTIDSETQVLATALAARMSTAPLAGRAEIATVLGTTIHDTFADVADRANKTRAESVARALAPVSDFRTWNLLVDVIAQSGRIGPGAKSLEEFLVEGERRVWVHLIIDRYTGKIVFQHTEPVYD